MNLLLKFPTLKLINIQYLNESIAFVKKIEIKLATLFLFAGRQTNTNMTL